MQKPIIALALFGLIQTAVYAGEGLVSVKSAHDVPTTTDKLVAALEEKGMTVFARIDHAAGAKKVEMTLAPTELVIFGNPKLGTALMKCGHSVAIDLPLKALIWEDGDGQTWLGYNDPGYLATRHGLEGCDQVLGKVLVADATALLPALVEEVGDQLRLEGLADVEAILRPLDLRDHPLLEEDEERLVGPPGHRAGPEAHRAVQDGELARGRRPRGPLGVAEAVQNGTQPLLVQDETRTEHDGAGVDPGGDLPALALEALLHEDAEADVVVDEDRRPDDDGEEDEGQERHHETEALLGVDLA
jgi:uncharacterized protein (DUF302 family)